MARPCDDALRWRVIEAIRSGMSTRAAARRFAVGESTAGEWMRAYRARGHVRPKPMGGRRGSKRDPHADFMFDLIETSVGRDVRLDEIVARPAARGRGVTACRALVGRYLLEQIPRASTQRPLKRLWRRCASLSGAESIFRENGVGISMGAGR